ncbi:germination protein YpeB [Paenibacillus tarimensis]
MYQRLSAVLFPIMAVLLVGAVYWGYQEHQEKNSILIKAENQYQRAFHELSYDMEQLHSQLGNALAVNSKSQNFHRKSLVNVWRLTSEAQNKITQLPLTLVPFHDTEQFLAKIANFSYRTAVRDLTKEPLTDKEYATLKELYKNSEEISKDIQAMQTKVLENNLRWMDVEIEIAAEQSNRDNAIIDGFRTVDKKVNEYPELNWGPSVSAMFEKRTLTKLNGKKATPEEIRAKAADFLGLKDPGQVRVVENGQGTEYASYSATVSHPNQEGTIQMDYSQNGGNLIWFINPREVGKKQVGFEEAKQNAKQFLEKHGYPGMSAVSYDTYKNVGNITFVTNQDGVLIYPEKLTVKVALDNGEPVGMQANEYVFEHHKRELGKPKISSEEAKKTLNSEFKVMKEDKALIKNEMTEEVLCYEFTGKINGHFYRIYVNADNGSEEMIEELPGINGQPEPSVP